MSKQPKSLPDAWRSLGNRPATVYRYWGDAGLEFAMLEEGFLVAGLQKLCVCRGLAASCR